MQKKIAVLGAFDRFNYGDLLFPIVIEKVLNLYKIDCQIDYYGLIKSDLRQYGAKPTSSIRMLFEKTNLPEGSILIVAGGEVLSAKWINMYLHLLHGIPKYILYGINIIFGENISSKISRYQLGSRLQLPWIISPLDFSSSVKVIYNTVGGVGLLSLTPNYQNVVKEKLSKATFLSVRDGKTKDALNTFGLQNVEISPDSAILISEFFPIDRLKNYISSETIEIINRYQKGYICFQSNRALAKNKEHLIASELQKIYDEFGYAIVLLPLGRASGHSDQIALKKIKKHLRAPSIIPNESNIYDIMILIAKSKTFAGTSLHGNITALSYCTPHIGLTTKVPKLEAFLKSDPTLELSTCVPFTELYDKIKASLNISEQALECRRNALVAQSYNNFNKIMVETELLQ